MPVDPTSGGLLLRGRHETRCRGRPASASRLKRLFQSVSSSILPTIRTYRVIPMFRTLLAVVVALVMAPAAWAQSSYRIQAGDVLQMEVLEDPSLNRSLLFLPDGSVSVPLAGTVKASGQTIDGLRSQIADALASNFATKPTIFLSVGQVAQSAASSSSAASATTPTIDVYAVGEVAKPGLIQVAPGTTLLQFLAASGGLSKFAAAKRIQMRRVDHKTGLESVYNFNYKSVQNGGKAPHIVLQDGDVIVVPERKLFE